MTEHIITSEQLEIAIEAIAHELSKPINEVYIRGEKLPEIVRCRDCEHYYETEEYHPQGNYDRRCCKYFGTYDDEVEPDGFCAWAKRKEGGE